MSRLPDTNPRIDTRRARPDASAGILPLDRRDALAAAIILIAVLVVGAPGITLGGLGWSDAPGHTFDGIFVLEYVRACLEAGPDLLEPQAARQWAERFYLRHPALGIIVYWPPGFAIVEAGMFALFGVSVTTARATVLLFAFGAGLLTYRLGKRWFDTPTGLIAALLLISCPHGARWLNDVMLEWPATFWVLAAALAYQLDRDTRRKRWSVLFAATLVLAFLTKQTAVFIGPVLLVHALLAADRRAYLLRPALLVSLTAAAAIIAGYLFLTLEFTALPRLLLRPVVDLHFLPAHLPQVVGWPLLPVALLGLATFAVAPDRRARGLLLLWFVAWAVFCSVIAAKEPRYLFFAVPPMALAASRFFIPAAPPGGREAALSWARDAPRLSLLILLILAQVYLARSSSLGRLPDHAPAVAELAGRPDADLVLVDALRDGQFIFDLYRHPTAAGKIIPLRASKLLYARAARMEYDPRVFVETEQDIVDILDNYGIRYIIIESAFPKTHYQAADPMPRKRLRRLLATDSRFTLVKSWPLRCGDPIWQDVELCLYTYTDCPPRGSDSVNLSFPAMGRDVTFQLP